MAEPAQKTPTDEQAEIDLAWKVEIRRRVEAVRSGTAKLIDGDEALASIRARIAAHQKD